MLKRSRNGGQVSGKNLLKVKIRKHFQMFDFQLGLNGDLKFDVGSRFGGHKVKGSVVRSNRV